MPKFLAKYSKKSLLLFAAGLICLIAGGVLLGQRFLATHGRARPPKPDHVVTTDISSPDESKVTAQDAASYTVPADQPRSILLPTISASGLIQKVGLTADNAMAVPSNIHFAGWFAQSVAPGKPGLSIIDGHVSGRYADGVFKNLKNLKTGDPIGVEFGDKSIRPFEVISVASMPEAEAAKILFDKHDDIDEQLNLITCDGKFNKATQRYADRVIVVAKLTK